MSSIILEFPVTGRCTQVLQCTTTAVVLLVANRAWHAETAVGSDRTFGIRFFHMKAPGTRIHNKLSIISREAASHQAPLSGTRYSERGQGKAPRTPRSRVVRTAVTNVHRGLSTIAPGNGARRNRSLLYMISTAIVSRWLREGFFSIIFRARG